MVVRMKTKNKIGIVSRRRCSAFYRTAVTSVRSW